MTTEYVLRILVEKHEDGELVRSLTFVGHTFEIRDNVFAAANEADRRIAIAKNRDMWQAAERRNAAHD